VVLFVDGGPGATLSLFLGNTAIFIAFLDVLGLPFLLTGITRLVAPRHGGFQF
jgi:hypothetical protein